MRHLSAAGNGAWSRSSAFLFASVFLFCSTLLAQMTLSTIRGTAADQTGAVIPKAQLVLVSLDTNQSREVTTNENGDFEIPDLIRGRYRLTATAGGFKTFVAENILLEGNQIRRINVTFELGAVGSEVTVRADAAVIQTDTSKLQSALNTTKHFDTPWVGAEAAFDPSLFITTLPLISQTGGVWSSQWAGQSSSQVQEAQDGHTNDDAVNQINNILDSQEITVVTVNNTAEFARVGYMNMITKSGTNDLHGRLAYFHQNSALGAREFFEDTKAKQLLHTITASAAGPVIKDKLFFFASANILKVPSKQFYLRTVPTVAMRGGDFSALLPKTVIKDPLTGTPFPGNVIPTSRLNALSSKVNEKYLPSPNRGAADSLANNFGFTFPFPTDYHLRKDFTQRIDYQINSKHRLTGRMIENWGLYVLPTNYPAFAWTRVRFNVHSVFEETYVVSPTLVNSVRVGFYKEKSTDGDPLYGVTPFKGDEAVKELGLQGVNPKGYSAQGFPTINITGYPALRTQPGGVGQNDHDWGFADTVTWSRGRHVLKFGGEYKPQSRFAGNIPENTYGNFSFNGSFTGHAYSDFMLGIPFTSTRLDPLTNRVRKDSELGIFLTDSFKATSRLTLDLGLRWDRFGSPTFEDNLMLNWDMKTGNVVIPAGTESKVSPLYPKTIKIVTGEVRQQPSNKNFVPRVGFAYRLDDKTVLRGGFGMFTETLGRYSRLQGGGPFQISETYQNAIENGQAVFAFPNPFPTSLTGARIPSQGVTGYPLETENGKIYQFNLTVERQVRDLGLRLSYVGSRNRGMNYSVGVNSPAPSLIPFTTDRRIYPQFNSASWYQSDGMANFNSLTFEVQRKVGQLTFGNHWTWASNYSNNPNTLYPYGPKGWTRDSYTPRQRAVFNMVWEVPVGKGRRFMSSAPAVANAVLGGWQLYWIGYLETGKYFSPSFSGSDPSNTNSFGGRPDRICNGNLPSSERSIDHWFDASCFAVPTPGNFGNSGNNILEGPGFNMQHISIAKTFNMTERFKFTFTSAISNALNHPNFSNPSGNISTGDVGVVNSLVEGARGRKIELRGRIDF
ncbi:MAG TPA: TonB-dependent receptor [Bryobacteraceae bacterium]|nr:TonB-dependent receptor [Bryobacteraceae bacterium]